MKRRRFAWKKGGIKGRCEEGRMDGGRQVRKEIKNGCIQRKMN